MESLSFFDNRYTDWTENPTLSFATWLSRKDLKKSSMEIYIWMWGKFVRWMTENGLRLDTLDGRDLSRFLTESGQTKLQTYHYLRLIEKTYLFINGLPDAPPSSINPASTAIQSLQTHFRNAASAFLPEWARQRVASYVEKGKLGKIDENDEKAIWDELGIKGNSTSGGATGTGGGTATKNLSATKRGSGRLSGQAGRWKEVRDIALLGVFAGGGLRVSEAERLTISCISDDCATLELQDSPAARGNSVAGGEQPGGFARVIPLEPFAVSALRRWLTVRTDAGTSGDAVFPSTTKGKSMDPATIFRRVKQQLDLLGLADIEGRSCCQTLRNSYIATLFDRGHLTDEEIAQQIGIVEMVSITRLRNAYLAAFRREVGEDELELQDDEL